MDGFTEGSPFVIVNPGEEGTGFEAAGAREQSEAVDIEEVRSLFSLMHFNNDHVRFFAFVMPIFVQRLLGPVNWTLRGPP